MLNIMPPKKKSKDTHEFSRKFNTEKALAKKLLEDFNAKGSRGEALIEQILHRDIKTISRNGLIGLGTIISGYTGINFPRNNTRKRDLIIKWFDDNELIIRPIAHNITVEFCEHDQENDKFNFDAEKV